MARSSTKELERLIKLLEKGAISEKEYAQLRQAIIDGKPVKKKNKASAGNKAKAFFLFLACMFGYNACNSDTANTETKSPQSTSKLTAKQCDQIWKDESYYSTIGNICMNLENSISFYQNLRFDVEENFVNFANKNNCKHTEKQIMNIMENTRVLLNQKFQVASVSTEKLKNFCEAEKQYFGKIIQKYNLD